MTDLTTSSSVLQVAGLRIQFGGDDHRSPVVDGVDLDVRTGELVALLGESGSGKTLTARAVMGLQPPTARVTADRLRLGEVDLLGCNAESLRRLRGERMSMVLQDALSALNPVLTIGNQLGEVLRVHRGLNKRQARARSAELLDLVEIIEPSARLDDYPHQFSGGMRQRILIAMAIALEPDLLIADEPTTALDVTVQAQILRLLHDLRQRLGMGILLITHDIGVVTEVADRVVVMREGAIVESGEADDVLVHPQATYTQNLLRSAPHPEPPRRLDQEDEDDGPILVADNLTRVFRTGAALARREVRAVDRVGLSLHRGETLAIVGESGSGKSTLARVITGLETVDDGAITYRGRDITPRRGHRRIRSGIQMVFQDPYTSLDPRMRVEDIITEPARVTRTGSNASRRDRAAELLQLVGLETSIMDRYPHQFSGGQRQRIGIARALMREPDVLVCDEPVSALDVTIQAQVVHLLAGLQERLGVGVIFISHDLSVVRNLAHRVLVMYRGVQVETGPVDQIFDRPQQDYTRALLASIPPLTRSERGKLINAA